MSDGPRGADGAPGADLRTLAEQAQGEEPLGAAVLGRLLRLAAAGDPAARDRLFRAYAGLAARLAEARRERGLDPGDLLQEASLGLMAFIDARAPAAPAAFEAELEASVGRHLDRVIESEAEAVRQQRRLVEDAEAYERAEIEIGRLRGRQATETELAEKLEWSVAKARRLGGIVKDARRRHDEGLLPYLEPDVPAEGELGR